MVIDFNYYKINKLFDNRRTLSSHRKEVHRNKSDTPHAISQFADRRISHPDG